MSKKKWGVVLACVVLVGLAAHAQTSMAATIISGSLAGSQNATAPTVAASSIAFTANAPPQASVTGNFGTQDSGGIIPLPFILTLTNGNAANPNGEIVAITFSLPAFGTASNPMSAFFTAPTTPQAGFVGSLTSATLITFTGSLLGGSPPSINIFVPVNIPDSGGQSFDLTVTAVNAPEPSSWALGGLGVAMMVGLGWRRRRKNVKQPADETTTV